MIYGMWFNSSGGGGGGATSVGDKLIKTGQTTSYRTGDDGDIEAGRDVDFTTLKANNPFGNTNRFTDELGTQTYANDIVIDWSTYDGSEVLGYYKGDAATARLWNDAIDWGVALSVGTFTSGWRLANIKELQNICNFSVTPVINYAPFSLSVDLYASTTWVILTDRAYFLDNSHGYFGVGFKPSASYRTLGVRDFTVTGTTLT